VCSANLLDKPLSRCRMSVNSGPTIWPNFLANFILTDVNNLPNIEPTRSLTCRSNATFPSTYGKISSSYSYSSCNGRSVMLRALVKRTIAAYKRRNSHDPAFPGPAFITATSVYRCTARGALIQSRCACINDVLLPQQTPAL